MTEPDGEVQGKEGKLKQFRKGDGTFRAASDEQRKMAIKR